MATQITNQATLNYTSDATALSVSSNLATITMQDPLEVSKHWLEEAYRIGEEITHNVFISNTGANPITNITLVDNLGTSSVRATETITPLSYISPAKTFINNEYAATIDGVLSTEGDSVTFTIDSLAAGTTVMLQYKHSANQYAGPEPSVSQITNTISVTATGFAVPITATGSITAAAYAKVTVEKTMSPDPVVDGSTLTYTFNMLNYGTIAATDAALQDVFNPTPVITSVTADGAVTTDYSYEDGTFRYPAAASAESYTIPAATFTQDSVTGVVTVVPGRSTIVVQGTI